MSRFELAAPYRPCGDQPEAIEKLVASLNGGARFQTLLGVTGSGKTYTMANVIERLQRPVLVITHNKTLAAQLYAEFKGFFPKNAVEYFISYFDYYQPEAYIPQTDTYIEKDSAVNEEIERLRLSATSSLLQRRDVIIVASVSCIYGLGSPEDYQKMVLHLWTGQQIDRRTLLGRLVDMQYSRNDIEFGRGTFRARGDVVELHPANSEEAVRIELFGDTLERITRFEPLTGDARGTLEKVSLFPAKHYVTPYDTVQRAIVTIREELAQRLQELESQKKLLEAQRLKMRTTYDLEMLQEMGFCNGIENYSRHLTGRAPGAAPYTLLDFFPQDYLTLLDESHASIPQIGGMYAGDRSRKTVLVEHGFRLPSALDNRPLNFEEFLARQKQVVCISATPGEWELRQNPNVIEQIIRPTGLTDPQVTVRPLKGQIDDLLGRARERAALKERVLVTTLTKRTAEDLTDYLRELGVRVKYLHSEIGAIERVDILRGLRKGDFDVLVGINLLREGLDLPEVSLVAILDADKTGFLRSERSLIQTAGRAARHLNGEVVLYADVETDAIKGFLRETRRRREKQLAYNLANKITPRSVNRALEESLAVYEEAKEVEASVIAEAGGDFTISELIHELEDEMERAAGKLEFERAAILRDQVEELKKRGAAGASKAPEAKAVAYRPAAKTPRPKKERKGPPTLTKRRVPGRTG